MAETTIRAQPDAMARYGPYSNSFRDTSSSYSLLTTSAHTPTVINPIPSNCEENNYIIQLLLFMIMQVLTMTNDCTPTKMIFMKLLAPMIPHLLSERMEKMKITNASRLLFKTYHPKINANPRGLRPRDHAYRGTPLTSPLYSKPRSLHVSHNFEILEDDHSHKMFYLRQSDWK